MPIAKSGLDWDKTQGQVGTRFNDSDDVDSGSRVHRPLGQSTVMLYL